MNYNMPFRCLEYIVAHYNRLFEKQEKYHEKQVPLPRPECYVFYNGDRPFPKESEMKLSDAFREIQNRSDVKLLPETLNFELTVKVFNINLKENHPILEKCLALFAYSKCNEYVRIAMSANKKNPIGYAIERCIAENVLADYFQNLSKEDMSMIFGEWDEEMYIKVQREEAFEDGQEANAIENARNALNMGLTAEQTAQITSLSLEKVLALQEELNVQPAIAQ